MKGFVFECESGSRRMLLVVSASTLSEAKKQIATEGYALGDGWRAKPFHFDRQRVVYALEFGK